MRVISLQAENIKKLVAIEIKPTGDIVIIAGKNGSGKTSTLDCLWWAICGTSNIQSQPIRKGQKKARIRLDMGELIVERRFTEAGSTLIVENAQGARFKSPQSMLDALLGALSFDPLGFSRMEPRKQFDELRRISELEVDIDALDGRNRAEYEKRTEINREAKAKRAQADGIKLIFGAPADAIDETALVDELQRAGEQNTAIEAKRSRRIAAQNSANAKKAAAIKARDRAAQLRTESERLREESNKIDMDASTLLDEAAEIEKMIDGAPAIQDQIDVTAIRRKIDEARATNQAVAERNRTQAARDKAIQEAEALEAQSRSLTESMEARETAKADAIAKAKLPVDGLGFGAGMVTFGGIPFDQASAAEQLRVSMAIAMAANPKLRVIRITDGSLLDEDSLALIAEMAKEGDYQVWIERVETSGKVGIVIEEGMVKVAETVE